MDIYYWIIGISLSLLVGILAVRYEKKQSVVDQATAKLPWLRFVRFISSWKVFFVLIIPSLVVDYLFFDGEAIFFWWFIVLYLAFILPLSFSYYRPPFGRVFDAFHASGKKRLAAFESQDQQVIRRQQKLNQIRYILILAALALALLFGFYKGY
ncbi:MAG: hypothetical protein Q7S75_01475 [bacterium]|nr:hypothetical protein [bacterium]